MPIMPFLFGDSFDQPAIADLARVYVAVCDRLGLPDRTDRTTEAVAQTIMGLAQRGIRDTEMLRKMTLMAFNVIE